MNTVEPIVKAFVSEGASSKIVVQIIDDSIFELLMGLGFVVALNKGRKILSITVSGQDLKATMFAKLRDEGVCFSGGPDWCPADVFEFLRDKNMLSGFYRKIVWGGPGKPMVIENC